MDDLEQFIKNKRDSFQEETPHEGHFERFEMKLDKQRKKKPIRLILSISSVAAALVLALILFSSNQSKQKSLTLSDLSDHYAEVEFYYTSSIKQQTQLLKSIASGDREEDSKIKILLKEMEEYDTVYDQLCKDLEATPNDQRVINALIDYYQTKLGIINKILTELENKREEKYHENITI